MRITQIMMWTLRVLVSKLGMTTSAISHCVWWHMQGRLARSAELMFILSCSGTEEHASDVSSKHRPILVCLHRKLHFPHTLPASTTPTTSFNNDDFIENSYRCLKTSLWTLAPLF